MPLCDIGYVIRDHIPSIFQGLSIDLQDLNIPLQPTRCFYTAILIMYLLLGKVRDLSVCDVKQIQTRFSSEGHDSIHVIDELIQNMFSSKLEHRVFYILLSNYESTEKNQDGSSKFFFPGHVFVVEQMHNNFNLYQSYINRYRLDEYAEKAKGFAVGARKMRSILLSIKQILQTDKWDMETSRLWSKFTHVSMQDSMKTIGMPIPGNILLCYRESKVEDCNSELLKFLNKHIAHLEKLNADNPNMIYGSHNSKMNEFEPLTVATVLQNYKEIKEKIDPNW